MSQFFALAYIHPTKREVVYHWGCMTKSVVEKTQEMLSDVCHIPLRDTVVYTLPNDRKATIDACISDANICLREGMFHFEG